MDVAQDPARLDGLIAFWPFDEPAGAARVARGPFGYELREMNGPIERDDEGVFGGSARLREGQWFNLPRAACPALNIAGQGARVSVVAWIKRQWRADAPSCEAIAGMWNELNRKRQYCLFIGAMCERDKLIGHVSAVGGPTPGHRYCMTGAATARDVPCERWITVAFTYDGREARAYLDGQLDPRDGLNPFPYPQGLFDGGAAGADFTVGGVARQEPGSDFGNYFVGHLGGLAVYDRALSADEVHALRLVEAADKPV